MYSAALTCALLALVSCPLATAFRFTQNINFSRCHEQLLGLNNTAFNDPAQFAVWNNNRTFVSNPRQLVLTFHGCEKICGDGYQLWPSKDTLGRLSLWVLPAIILLTHFHFPPLRWHNTMSVIIHAAGDPLDSLWSMLIRLETQRRLLHAAKAIGFQNERDYKYVAAVWAAYEEIGWQDASRFFQQSLESRMGRQPNKQEMYHIMLASHELWSNRQESILMTWVAIFTLIGALVTAVVRTIEQTEQENTRIMNETAHSIALLSLLFMFIPLVKFSGDIGSFSSTSVAVNTIENLNRGLKSHTNPDGTKQTSGSPRNETPLFPPLSLDPDVDWDCREHEEYQEADERGATIHGGSPRANIECWPEMASYFGMNSSWRPRKAIRVSIRGQNPWTLYLYAILFAIVGSCIPAVLLSATNHAGRVTFSVGCRNLSWIIILSTWVFSSVLDYALRLIVCKARTLWRYTIEKDCIVAALIVVIVLAEQVGIYNTCWCRSNVVSLGAKARVNLNPYSSLEWGYAKLLWSLIPSLALLFVGGFTFFIEYHGGRIRGPLCKSSEQVQQNLVRLEGLREEIWPLSHWTSSEGNGDVMLRGIVSSSDMDGIEKKSVLKDEITELN